MSKIRILVVPAYMGKPVDTWEIDTDIVVNFNEFTGAPGTFKIVRDKMAALTNPGVAVIMFYNMNAAELQLPANIRVTRYAHDRGAYRKNHGWWAGDVVMCGTLADGTLTSCPPIVANYVIAPGLVTLPSVDYADISTEPV